MSSHTPSSAVRGNFRAVIENGIETVNRRPRLWLTIFALLLAAQIRPWWLPETDGRKYLSMAHSLAVEGEMQNLGSAHLWYFPGYPLVISPLYWISERPLWLFSAFHWMTAIGFMLGVYWWAKSVVPQWAVWIAGLSVMNEGVWIYCARTMSEVPFMCALIWSANAALAAARSRSAKTAISRGTLAAALLALTALMRPAGILLAVGFGLHLGWKALRHELSWTRAVALTLAFGIPGSLEILLVMRSERAHAAAESAPTYLNNFRDLSVDPVASYAEGVRLAIRDSGRIVVPGMFKTYQDVGWWDQNLLIYIPACAVLAFGWWRLAQESRDPLLLAVPFYLLLHIAYPIEAGARLFIPLVPIFMASLIRLLVTMPRGRLLAMGGLLSAHLTIALVYWLAVDAPRGKALTAVWDEAERLMRPIDVDRDCVSILNLNPDDIFVFELIVDRPVFRYGTTHDRDHRVLPEARWIVSNRETPVVPGFTVCAETESLRLLRRSATAAADVSTVRR